MNLSNIERPHRIVEDSFLECSIDENPNHMIVMASLSFKMDVNCKLSVLSSYYVSV